MLKISQNQAASEPAVLPEEETPVPEMPVEAPAAPIEAMGGGGKVSPATARYLLPEQRCGVCIHYLESKQGGECDIVSGPIDPNGSCSLYEEDSMDEASLPEEPVAPVTDEVPEEA